MTEIDNIQNFTYYALILASVILVFCSCLICILCSCISCFRSDNHSNSSKKNKYFKERFDVIPYESIYNIDKNNIINIITDDDFNNVYDDDTNVTNSKCYNLLKCFKLNKNTNNNSKTEEEKKSDDQDSKTIIHTTNNADDNKSKLNNNSEELESKKVEQKEESESKLENLKLPKQKTFIYYSFDNLSNDDDDDGSSTILSNINDDSENVFRDLEAFINIVLKTINPDEVVIIIRISSPGGYAYKFELAYTHLMRLRNNNFHLVALVDDICASGGYMLACACNEILCSEYASIGSVGVVTGVYNYHNLLEKIGLVEKTITTGSYKRPFLPGEPYDEKGIERVRESVTECLDIFKEIVCKSRKLTEEQLEEILKAKVFYGRKALKLGLVDNIITSNDYLDLLYKEDCDIFLTCRKKKIEKPTLLSLLELNTSIISNKIHKIINNFMKYKLNREHKNFMNTKITNHLNKIL